MICDQRRKLNLSLLILVLKPLQICCYLLLPFDRVLHVALIDCNLLQRLCQLCLFHILLGVVVSEPSYILTELVLHLFKFLKHYIRQLANTFLDYTNLLFQGIVLLFEGFSLCLPVC